MAAVSLSNGRSSLPGEEFRIEFDDQVFPPPVSRLAQEVVEEEDFEARLQETQEELLQLKHQARLVERRKEELEEINRKERDFSKGRTDMQEKLGRALVTLERETAEARRRFEVFTQTRQDLTRHHRAVTALRSDNWERSEINEQLDHALAVIKDAQLDFERTMRHVEPLLPASPAARSDVTRPAPVVVHNFRYWLRAGFAFTLPLIVLGVVALMVSTVF
ncbi:MAG: hypothetical protein ACR2OZ_14505 [Verrucomicrobiales bacterium]